MVFPRLSHDSHSSEGEHGFIRKSGKRSIPTRASKFDSLKFTGSWKIGLLDRRHILIQLTKEEDYALLFGSKIMRIENKIVKFLKWTVDFDPQIELPIMSVWVESSGGLGNKTTTSMMQKFWDSAMAIGPSDEEELRSEASIKFVAEAETSSSPAFPFSGVSTAFSFKLEDKSGRMHRFSCDTRSMTDLITCILQKVGDDINRDHLPQILYEDEDHDKVVLSSDSDLVAAVEHAKLAGWKGLRLYLDTSGSHRSADKENEQSVSVDYSSREAWQAAYKTIAAGAALVVGLSMVAYLKRTGGSS